MRAFLLVILLALSLNTQAKEPQSNNFVNSDESQLDEHGSYTNADGIQVHKPAHDKQVIPSGATAQCRDGTYSFGLNHRGTCSHHTVEHKAVSLIKTKQVMIGLNAALSAISAKEADTSSVLLLGRFKFRKPELADLKQQYPQIKLQFMTVHASKGSEADYVVVLGLEKGKRGFPSEKATHPLLEFLLPKAENFEYAEERRLFYVSLTRARHHVYLIADGDNPSSFIREMVAKDYPILTDEFTGDGFQDKLANISCTVCKTGYMIARDGQFGSFFGCSNFPLCNHTQKACQWCGSGLISKGRFRVCENPRCDFVEPICPQCEGSLALRKGPFGKFWGCSNYRSDADFSCGHKEKFIDLQAAR